MAEWKTYTLKELSKGRGEYGIGAPAVPFDKEKYTYLRITDINDDGTLNTSGMMSVDADDAEEYILEKNDIVFARTGNSTGRSYFYDGRDGELVYAGFLIRFRLDETKVNPKILKYYTHSKPYYDWVKSFDTGGTRGNINAKTYGDMPIYLPPRHIQDRIAGILSAIDDKIENNRRINTNLELQAQALYKQWFVDFDFPNEDGKPYKSSGGKMVDSELGPIPEGWSVKRLDDYTVIKRGGSPRPIQNYLSNTGLNWLKISDATSTNSPFILEIKEFIKEEGLSKTVFLKKGNLVLSNSATPCIPKFLGLDTCIHDGWLYFPNAKLSKEYLYLLFKNNRQEILSQGNGSVFLNLKTDILKSHLICLPNCIEKMNCFNMIVKAIFKNIENCSFEIKRLATLRDALLPKLMNGEIKL